MAEKAAKSAPFLVSVEGNIGSGKSTMLNFFKEFPDVHLSPEPVDQWCDLQGHNLLQLLYEDPKRWSFQFQSYVQLTRMKLLKEPAVGDCRVRLIERSIQNNRFCFLELAERLGSLSQQELAVLKAWYDWLDSTMDLRLDLIVYLRTTPEVAYSRMRTRGREAEKAAQLSYLSALHDAYEDWLVHHKMGAPPAPVLVIDADQDLDTLRATYTQHINRIRNIPPEVRQPLGDITENNGEQQQQSGRPSQ